MQFLSDWVMVCVFLGGGCDQIISDCSRLWPLCQYVFKMLAKGNAAGGQEDVKNLWLLKWMVFRVLGCDLVYVSSVWIKCVYISKTKQRAIKNQLIIKTKQQGKIVFFFNI